MKRPSISKRRRFEVFKRDNFSCTYCGAHPPGVLLHIDHITALAAGGSNDDDNLTTACEACNLGKGARDLRVAPESLSDKAARVAEAEEQLAGFTAVMEARAERIEADVWRVVEVLYSEQEIRRDWYVSIKRFVERLNIVDVCDAAETSRGRWPYQVRKRFLYFCGICWRMIKEADDGEGEA